MRKILFFVCSLLMFTVSHAQVQITDFENVAFKSPNGVQFLDTLNKRILVFVTQPEQHQQQSLWSSDGTLANTKILKDEFGESASPQYGENFKVENFYYLKGQHIWRTDGQKLERIVSNSDTLGSLQKFNNKPLLTFRRYEKFGNQWFYFFTFAWLDSLNKVNVFDRDIVHYQINDTTLHYLKLNKQTKFFELHSLSGNKHYKSVIAIAQADFSISNFEIFTQKDTDFYFLNTSQGKKLFSKKRNDTTDVTSLSLLDWGSNQYYAPMVLKDEFEKVYFINYSSSINILKIYALTEQNTLTEKWSIQSPSFFPEYFSYQIKNMSIIGDKIIFNIITGSEGINGFYFNVFDIKKNVNQKSRNLGSDFGNKFYGNINVTQKDANTYELDNKTGLIATYSFLVDSVTSIRTYPYNKSYLPDSVFTLNQQKVLISTNLHNITDGSKKELISSKQIFELNITNNFYQKTLGDKLLLWYHNPKLGKSQLWVSDGEKNGRELLATLDGDFGNTAIIMKGKTYFYTYQNTNQLSIYESDGTKAGTSRIFKTDGTYRCSIHWVKSNTNQIIFKCGSQDSVDRIVFVENSKATLLENVLKPNCFYEVIMTSKKSYLIVSDRDRIYRPYYDDKIYSISNVGLTLIVDKTADYVVYEDKLFFTKRIFNIENGLFYYSKGIFGIHFIDNENKVYEFVKEEIDEYNIYGNKLVYKNLIARSAPKYTIIDLPTNKIDLILDNFYSYYIQSLNGALVLHNQEKILIIRNKQKREFDAPKLIEAFDKGIVLGESKKLTYYDISKNEIKPIVIDKTYERPTFTENYILIAHRENENTLSWSYWNKTNQKLTSLENSGDFYYADAMQAFSSKRANNQYEVTYWRFDGNNFYKNYVVTRNLNAFKSDTGSYFALKYSDETGNELIGLGAEGIITYPEVVNGSEGITLGSVFHFKKQLYIYAFTYTYGWQVWKMGEVDNGKPLAMEEISEQLPMLFPNPVQDYLQIDSQQKYQYRVINLIGQEVLRGEISPQANIDFSKLAGGLYIIQFSDGDKTFSKRIMKI